nr:unnamed protein product [Callosobruchus chinensis]
MNNLGFNNKAWGSPAPTDMLNRNTLQPPPLMSQNTGLGNLGRNIVPPFQQPQQVFQNAMGLQQQNIAGLGRGLTLANSAVNTSLNQPIGSNPLFQQVAYPNTRNLTAGSVSPGLNPAAFKATVQQTVQNAGAGSKQRVFTGKVTQIHENFGLVDEEVIFEMSACVKGSNPVVGDRVLVEASYTPNMHFKWSATRIQVLSVKAVSPTSGQSTSTVSGYNGSSSAYNAVPPPPPPPPPEASTYSRGDNGNSGGYSRQENFGGRGGDSYGRDNVSFVRPDNFSRSDGGGFGRSDNSNYGRNDNFGRSARQKATVGRGRERSREKDKDDDEIERKRRREERLREREKEEKKASPVRKRSRSPKTRRRSRVVPRYMVQIPKIALDLPNADVLELRRRYTNLYVPSDFFFTNIKWVDSFPPDKPFALNKSCSFHVMSKDIEPVTENTAVLEPADADYTFSAKVMLMSVPGLEELYQKCCGILDEKDKRDRDRESEERDYIHPTRLINFLVGLRGKNETMAIGGPWSPSLDGANPHKDPTVLIKTAIRTCKALTGIDLSNCTQWYRFVELYYRRGSGVEHKGKASSSRVETVVLFLPDIWSCLPTRLEWDNLQMSYRRRWEGLNGGGGDDAASDGAKKEDKDDNLSGGEENDEKKNSEPVHFSQLDPKTMSVGDLRTQLKSRGAPHKGLKSQLVARLTKLLKLEEQTEALKNEDSDNENAEGEDETEILLRSVKTGTQEDKDKEKKADKSEAEVKKLDERERALLEKRYALPDQQHIIVHPSKTAKSGKFDCTVMSLSLLLDYRQEDSKEHSFEVSLFAELFNEMLIRDFGFNIYKALTVLPDKPKEDKDKKDDKKEKDDKKDKDEKKDEKKEDKKDDDRKRDAEKKKSSDGKDKPETKDDKKDSKKDDQENSDDNDEDNEDRDKKRDKDKDKDKKKRVKLVTKDKQLLLSFIYFDQSHCGYIFDKDIEELLYTLGVQLSRAQVKKLVSKVVTRDSLHYRKLTDRPKDEEAVTMVTEVNLRELAVGNKGLLPVFKDNESSKTKSNVKQEEKDEEGRFVMFNGSLVDVGKLLAQLERSEKARLDTESRMVDLKSDNQKLQDKYNKSSSTIKHLNSELKEYKDKVRNTEDTLSKISSNSKIFYTTLVEIRDRIEPVLRSSSSKEDSLKKEKDEKDKKYDEAKSRWEKERDSKEAAIKKENDIKETDVDMKAEKTDDGSKKDN